MKILGGASVYGSVRRRYGVEKKMEGDSVIDCIQSQLVAGAPELHETPSNICIYFLNLLFIVVNEVDRDPDEVIVSAEEQTILHQRVSIM